VTRRISITLDGEELEALVRLRNLLDPGMPLASFAANALVGAVDAELHGLECQCKYWAEVLEEWRPDGRPN
jgi:hypothetical protein